MLSLYERTTRSYCLRLTLTRLAACANEFMGKQLVFCSGVSQFLLICHSCTLISRVSNLASPGAVEFSRGIKGISDLVSVVTEALISN